MQFSFFAEPFEGESEPRRTCFQLVLAVITVIVRVVVGGGVAVAVVAVVVGGVAVVVVAAVVVPVFFCSH